jgi:hypothetical protein
MVSSDISVAELDPRYAKEIIEKVGGPGQPPVYGFQLFTAGIGDYLSTIDDEYLADYIYHGGSSFKLVVGTYGGGKTHFLYSVQGLAWDHNYVSSYIELKKDSTPFHNLESVYKSVMANLLYRQGPEALFQGMDRGIEAVIRSWYYEKTKNLPENATDAERQKITDEILSTVGPFESTSWLNAIKHAFRALLKKDDDSFDLIIEWLKGEKPTAAEMRKFHIYEKLDKSTAFKFIRCLIRWLNQIGYSGLIILMDEAEQNPSGGTSKEREKLLNNLRELIDACSKGQMKSTMFFYAVPDEKFLQGKTNIYEALNQRVATIFEGARNPTGVKIYLENTSVDPEMFLSEIGQKLAPIYEKAYNYKFNETLLSDSIAETARIACEEKFGEISYKRKFVQDLIKKFHDIRTG